MEQITIHQQRVTLYRFDAIVIGTGCAGYNAADSLYDLGVTNIAILSEGVNMGTSRNTGSDKQTYYKLSLCSDATDSIFELAENLFSAGSVNGDIALAEAAGSVRSFMKLVQLGVPFPTNRYGEYVGYKTDHDPKRRATSCGPLTSKIMTEQLEKAVRKKEIPVFDGMTALQILRDQNGVLGVVAMDLGQQSSSQWGLCVFLAPHVVMATGGPAILYENSVYPPSQTGMTGMALEAGAKGCNLQEWQYGLASIQFRWNVSGTYQQVLPRYLSLSPQGEYREFLNDYFSTPEEALELVFLKGYQWPFDVKKIPGSSLIDLIVYHEIFHKGNRVFMDFRQNPSCLEQGFGCLSSEAYSYLEKSQALFGTPVQRLEKMNPQAIQLYAGHHIDLWTMPLEISVCAQHNNGGIQVDYHWESDLPGLFVVGEAAGTFGVTRPGGSALNSTQVGSFRAAQQIALSPRTFSSHPSSLLPSLLETMYENITQLLQGNGENPGQLRRQVQTRMSGAAAHVRDKGEMGLLWHDCQEAYRNFFERYHVSSPQELPQAFKTKDMLCTASAVLSAMLCAGNTCQSRGSALVLDSQGIQPHPALDQYRYAPEKEEYRSCCLITQWNADTPHSQFIPVKPLPKTDDWFETTWQEYNQIHGIG